MTKVYEMLDELKKLQSDVAYAEKLLTNNIEVRDAKIEEIVKYIEAQTDDPDSLLERYDADWALRKIRKITGRRFIQQRSSGEK